MDKIKRMKYISSHENAKLKAVIIKSEFSHLGPFNLKTFIIKYKNEILDVTCKQLYIVNVTFVMHSFTIIIQFKY